MPLTVVLPLLLAPAIAQAKVEYTIQNLELPVYCPKYRWTYSLFANASANGVPKFRIYAQSSKRTELLGKAAETFLNLHALVKERTTFDHPLLFGGVIDVFLAEGGKAGAEQGIFADQSGRKYSAIYLYGVETLENQLQREAAHEYGHAILPPIGPFKAGEPWGNGELGEHLFLKWLGDTNGAKACEGLADNIWLKGPNNAALAEMKHDAMTQYLSLYTYCDEAFPEAVGRALRLVGSQNPSDTPKGVVMAVQERASWTIEVPGRMSGKAIWLPITKSWRVQNAKMLAQRGEWVKVQPTAKSISITRSR